MDRPGVHKEPKPLRGGQRLGKYRLEKRLASGGFANVFQAMDTVEGVRVALKVPHARLMNERVLRVFRHEARLVAALDHPNILPIKNAQIVEGHFVIATPLGEETLHDRLKTRLSTKMALSYAEQLLDGLAYAHRRRILHSDVKPENLILFPRGRLRLTDFGIAKVVQRTIQGSGSGTVGYIAPEQAMGRPSLRSDVFSAGLVLYRLFSGRLPQWPFDPPLPGEERLLERLHPDLVALILRAIEVDGRNRYRDADQMFAAFQRLKPRALGHVTRRRTRRQRKTQNGNHWQEVRFRQFKREHGKDLEAVHACPGCKGPVSAAMHHCPWCRRELDKVLGESRFPAHCPRCGRGVKKDWKYCAWCYGPSIGDGGGRRYSDRRYTATCSNASCSRKELMPFMRYCPWCRSKVRRSWPVPGSRQRCPSCKNGVYGSYWSWCPWCARGLGPHAG